jgi:hypothetical protein
MARARTLDVALPKLALSFLATLSLVSSALLREANAIEPGLWTASGAWGPDPNDRYAVHQVLIPGDGNPYHSRILWFRGEKYQSPPPYLFRGGEWGWRSGNESCVEYPSSSFDDLGIGASNVDIFCSGHAAIPGGSVLITGGTHPLTEEYGENQARRYTSGSGTTAGTWTPQPPTMNDWRWYPTATTLRDGRVLVAGGDRNPHVRLFGGRHDGSLPGSPTGDRVYRFSPSINGVWETPVSPAGDNGQLPAIRERHTFTEMDRSQASMAGSSCSGARPQAGTRSEIRGDSNARVPPRLRTTHINGGKSKCPGRQPAPTTLRSRQ